MSHPYAGQAKASQARRLSKLGGKAGKAWGSSSMYKKTSLPSKNAGTERPMTLEGGSAKKRADRKGMKYADGGRVFGGGGLGPGFGGGAPKKATKKGGGAPTTNIVIAKMGGGRGRRRGGMGGGMGGGLGRAPGAVPVPVNRPVPVPVPVGGGAAPVGPPPVMAGGPPPMGPMPGGPPPGGGLPPGGPPPLGLKSGGAVRKADGGGIKKRQMGGGLGLGGAGATPAPRGRFQPGAVPGRRPPVVPLTGGGPRVIGDAGVKKGGAVHDDEAQDKKLISKMLKKEDKAEKKADGGSVDEEESTDDSGGPESTSSSGGSKFNQKKFLGGLGDLSKAIGGASGTSAASGGSDPARMAQSSAGAAEATGAGLTNQMRKLAQAGGGRSGGFQRAKPPSLAGTGYQDGGFVPKNEKSKDSALIASTYRQQGKGFNKGGSVKKAGAGSGPGRKALIAGARAVPAKTEI